MPTYAELISSIAEEAGQFTPANLPLLIREVERQLWQEFWYVAPETSETYVLPANTDLVNPLDTLWIHLSSVTPESTSEPLRRVSLGQFNRLKSNIEPLKIFCWDRKGSLFVAGTYYKDEVLTVVVRKRDDWIEDGDDETTKFWLGEGYNVLKYGCLYKRVFAPDRWEMWRQRYYEAVDSMLRSLGLKAHSYRGGTWNYDAPTTY